MEVLVLILSLALAQSRDYCYGGNLCKNDTDCLQGMGDGTSTGQCCSGKCVSTYKVLARGAQCDDNNKCGGICADGDSCVKGVCTGTTVTYPCDCTNAQCSTYLVSSTCIGGKCQMPFPRGAACSSNTSCESGTCYQGTCLGRNLPIGDTCRLDQECEPYACIGSTTSSTLERDATVILRREQQDALSPHDSLLTLSPKCGYKTQGMSCQGTYECDKSKGLYCASNVCSPKAALEASCTTEDGCVDAAYCNTTTNTCLKRVAAGSPCYGESCVSGAFCMGGFCVARGSVPDYGYCETDAACKSTSTCGIYGTNATASFCIPKHSIAAGGNCSTDDSCPQYASCDLSQDPPVCTESYVNKNCSYNSSISDFDQCHSSELVCGCSSKCIPHKEDEPYCPYPIPKGDPTKMTATDLKQAVRYWCCSMCGAAGHDQISTSLTGYAIDCKSLTITASPVCSLTSGGAPLLINCPDAHVHDHGGDAAFGCSSNFFTLSLLLVSVLFFF